LLAAAADSADFLKYAPSREIQILHFVLDVTPDFADRSVSGSATLRFKPIASLSRSSSSTACGFPSRPSLRPRSSSAGKPPTSR